jgi:hypothetical protein
VALLLIGIAGVGCTSGCEVRYDTERTHAIRHAARPGGDSAADRRAQLTKAGA